MMMFSAFDLLDKCVVIEIRFVVEHPGINQCNYSV